MTDPENTVATYLKSLESRIKVLEDTIVLLLIALKEGGVIVDSDDESSDNQYHFNFE